MTALEQILKKAQEEVKEQQLMHEENEILMLQNELFKSKKRELELIKRLDSQEEQFLQKLQEQQLMHEENLKQILKENKNSNEILLNEFKILVKKLK